MNSLLGLFQTESHRVVSFVQYETVERIDPCTYYLI